jgi:hypothetical protein
MARWIMLASTILGFVLVFTTRNALVLGIGLLAIVIGIVGFIMALAADRVAANSRPDVAMASPEDLRALRTPPARPVAKPAAIVRQPDEPGS